MTDENITIRCANIEFSEVESIVNGNNILEMYKKYELGDYLKIVNPDLYKIIESKKINFQTENTIKAYLIRMVSRAEIFSVFGGIRTSQIEEMRYRIKLDPGFIFNTFFSFEKAKEYKAEELYYVSPLIFKRENMFADYTRYETKFIYDNTILYKFFEYMDSGKRLHELQEWLVCNSKISYDELLDFLIKRRMIVSQNEIDLNNYDQDKYIDRYCEDYKSYLISKYISQKDLNDLARKLVANEHKNINDIFFVNSYYPLQGCDKYTSSIKKIREDFKDNKLIFLRYLYFLTWEFRKMQNLELVIIEQYGYGIEFSINDFMNKYSMFFDMKNDTRDKLEKFGFIIKQYCNARNIYDVRRIVITEEDIKFFIKIIEEIILENNYCYLPKVIAEIRYQMTDENKVYFPSIWIGNSPGSIAGRYNNAARLEKNQSISDLAYFSTEYPELVMSNSENNNKICVDKVGEVGTNLSDLLIGVDEKGIYVKNKSSNKKIIPVSRNMYNYSYAKSSKILMILDQIGKSNLKIPTGFNLFDYLKMEHIPRIEFEDYILCKETWVFRFEKGVCNEDIGKEIIKKIELNCIPNYVSVVNKGTDFIVNTRTDYGIDYLVREAKRYNFLMLTELIKPKGERVEDIIIDVEFPGEKFDESCDGYIYDGDKPYLDITSYTLIFNEALTNYKIEQVCNWLNEEEITFFFIRYRDSNRPSLRLRVLENNHKKCTTKFSEMKKRGDLWSFFESDFVPEYCRYGGIENYDKVLQIFIEESSLYLPIRRLFGKKNINVFAAVIVIDFLVANFSLNVVKEFYDFNYPLQKQKYKNAMNNFKSNRDEILRIFDSIQTHYNELAAKLRSNEKNYISEIEKNCSKKKSNYIICSVLHMRLNRFIGCTPNEEKEIMYYSRFIFFNKFGRKLKEGQESNV